LIKEVIDEARGNTMIMVFPLVIPTALFMLAITGIVRRIRSAQNSSPLEALELIRFQDHELKLLRDVTTSQRTVRNDPRFRRLSELGVEVEVCRWPLVALLTVTLSLPALVLYLIAHGVRETMLIMPQLGLLFAHALRLPRPT
jgi:hypothetical protein